MINKHRSQSISRRDFFKLAGGVLVTAAGVYGLPAGLRKLLQPVRAVQAAPSDPFDLFFAGTDGWIAMPPSSPAIQPFFPDDLAPAPFNTYVFGFRNVTGLPDVKVQAQKMKAQHSAPLFWVKEYDPALGGYPDNHEFRLKLTNLGLQMRPDLTDAHTVHWHGFRNAIPYFDGEPHGSVSVPVGREIIYVYRAHEPGTYMYHCHVEDVEHVHMGMTGLVFVRPKQDGTPINGFTKFVYNDGDGSTGYDREYAMFLSEVWAEAHWADSHIQLPEWSDYHPDFSLLNGRAYPDTLAPSSTVDPFNQILQADGDLPIPPAPYEHLQYQPYSSLVQCNAGERVLLRFAQLGFKQAAMTLTGIPMRVVGKDATLLRGRDGTDTSYQTNTIMLGAGESVDAIFTAPPHSGGPSYDTYLLYNRALNRASNLVAGGFGGQMTEVRVYPAGTIAPQLLPNT